jgi:hypothetical protein
MTRHAQHLKVEVLKKEGYWVGLPVDAPGSMSGETLPQLFAEVEYSKYVCLWVPKAVPVSVEYLAADPMIRAELNAAYAAYMAARRQPARRPWPPWGLSCTLVCTALSVMYAFLVPLPVQLRP